MNELLFDISVVIKIRWKQLYRFIFEVGFVYFTFISAIIAFIGAVTYLSLADTQKSYMIVSFWILIIFFIHSNRKDHTFLKLSTHNPRWICGFEYILLTLPLFIGLSINARIPVILLAFFALIAVSFSKVRLKRGKKTLNTSLQRLIPDDMYEWKSGIRKYFYLIHVFWISGIGASFFVAGIPVSIFMLGLIISAFYEKNESWQILISFEKNPEALLLYKIRNHIFLFLIATLPLALIFMIIHFEYWYIPVIELVMFLSIHIYAIILKYAYYSHNRENGNTAFLIVGTLLGLIPVTTPVLWILSIFLFYKARFNLNNYLHDYY